MKMFGLEFIREDTVLDVKGSMFRYICVPHAYVFYAFCHLASFLCSFPILLVAWSEYTNVCAETVHFFTCDQPILIEASFFIALACNLYFFLTFCNGILYARHSNSLPFGEVPLLVKIQFYLYTTFLPLSITASVFYDQYVHPTIGHRVHAYRASVITPCVFMVFDALFASYEASWKHVFVSNWVIGVYVAVLALIQASGRPVYPDLGPEVALQMTILTLGVHLLLIGFQKIKVYRKYDTHWKPLPTLDVQMEPDGV